jgi:hypothetical protein
MCIEHEMPSNSVAPRQRRTFHLVTESKKGSSKVNEGSANVIENKDLPWKNLRDELGSIRKYMT